MKDRKRWKMTTLAVIFTTSVALSQINSTTSQQKISLNIKTNPDKEVCFKLNEKHSIKLDTNEDGILALASY